MCRETLAFVTSTLRRRSSFFIKMLLVSCFILTSSATATVAPQVRLDWSVDSGFVVAGQPIELTMRLTTGADVGVVEVEMESSPGWQLKSGSLLWRESINRNALGVDSQAISQRTVTVVPQAGQMEPITVKVRVMSPQEFETIYRIDLNQATPAGEDLLLPTPQVLDPSMHIREAEQTIPAELLELDRRCRDSILSSMAAERSQSSKGPMNAALGRTITVTGRIGYIDDKPSYHGVGGCRIRLKDDDSGSDDTIDETLTSSDGSFTLYCRTDQLGEEEPELYLMMYPDNPLRCKVRFDGSSSDIAARYPETWHHEPTDRWNVGWLFLPSESAGIWHVFNSLYQAHLFMDAYDDPAPKITAYAYAPAGKSCYNGTIRIAVNHIWQPWVHTHEFGHHIMRCFLESPSPDYCNGICDVPVCGHCMWGPEKGYVAVTEGWPDFLAEVCNEIFNYDDGWDLERYTGQAPTSDPKHVEGNIAAVLYDIIDSKSDDHDDNGLGDMLDLTFGEQWKAMRHYNPRGTGTYPLTADEIFDGFLHFYPALKYKLISTFQENELTPNLHFARLANDTPVLGGGLAEDLIITTVEDSMWSVIGIRPSLGDWDIRVDETPDFSSPFSPPMETGRTPDIIVSNGFRTSGQLFANVYGGILTTCLIETEFLPEIIPESRDIVDTIQMSEVLNLYQVNLTRLGTYSLTFNSMGFTEDVEVMVFSPNLLRGTRKDAIAIRKGSGELSFSIEQTGSFCVVVAKTGALSCRYKLNIDLRVPTGVDEEPDEVLPTEFALMNAYPNPFNPLTTIAYEVPRSSHVTLTIYNILGERVATLVDASQPAGRHIVTWDGASDHGNKVGSGVYFYRLTADSFSSTKKMVLLK